MAAIFCDVILIVLLWLTIFVSLFYFLPSVGLKNPSASFFQKNQNSRESELASLDNKFRASTIYLFAISSFNKSESKLLSHRCFLTLRFLSLAFFPRPFYTPSIGSTSTEIFRDLIFLSPSLLASHVLYMSLYASFANQY